MGSHGGPQDARTRRGQTDKGYSGDVGLEALRRARDS